jgi:hypothetical protein
MTEQTVVNVSYNKDKTWTVLIKQPDGTEVKQSLKLEGMAQVAMLAMLTRLTEFEEKARLWTQPTPEMVQAGLAEVQRMLDEWAETGVLSYSDVEEVSDDMASDMAVFMLQAMAGKLPKAGE